MPALANIMQVVWLFLGFVIMGVAPGYVLARLCLPRGAASDHQSRLEAIERWFLVVATSVGVTSILSLVLVQLGRFSLSALMVLLATGSVLAATLGARRIGTADGRGAGSGSPWSWGLLAILLLVGLALFTPPYQTALWGDDSTVYVGAGTRISTAGAFLVDDELVQSMSMDAREELFRNRTPRDSTGPYARFPGGIAIADLEGGRTAAGFSPLFPVWVAIFHQLLGPSLIYYVAPFFGLLGIASVFFAGRALGGDASGFVAALLLALCLPQVWFSRLPMSEGLAQFLVFSGLWALYRHLDTGARYLAAVAGLLMGAAVLARVDLLPILLMTLVMVVAVAPREYRDNDGARAFSSVFALLLLYALAHMTYFPSNYGGLIGARLERVPLGASLVSIAAGTHPALALALVVGLGGAMIVGLWLVLRRYTSDPDTRLTIARRAVWIGITLYTLAYFVSSRSRWTETIPWLAAYVSWPLLVVLAASVAGLILASARGADPKRLLLLTLLAAAAVHYLHNPQVIGADHVWVMRRFVPIVLPAIFLAIAAALVAFARRARPMLGSATALAIAGAMLFLVARPSLAVWGTSYWSDVARVTESVATSFPRDAVVLVAPELAGTHLPVTLTYQHGVDAILLQRRRPVSSILHGQITDWLRAGREVYLVGAAADVHFYAPDIALSNPMIHDIDFLVLETTDSPPPREPTRRKTRITAFRALLRQVGPKTFVDVGDYADDALFVLGGLHGPEGGGAGGVGSFRWTGKEAFIEVPAAPSISVVVGGGRPAGAQPARVSVLIEDEPVVEERAVPDEPTRITLRNPYPSSSGRVTVRLRSNVFNPRRAGFSDDGRDLGVRLYRVDFGELRDLPPALGRAFDDVRAPDPDQRALNDKRDPAGGDTGRAWRPACRSCRGR